MKIKPQPVWIAMEKPDVCAEQDLQSRYDFAYQDICNFFQTHGIALIYERFASQNPKLVHNHSEHDFGYVFYDESDCNLFLTLFGEFFTKQSSTWYI